MRLRIDGDNSVSFCIQCSQPQATTTFTLSEQAGEDVEALKEALLLIL